MGCVPSCADPMSVNTGDMRYMKNRMHDDVATGPVVPSVWNATTALCMLEENGIDTTELVASFEDGDIHAIHAFFQKIRPTGAGTGIHRSDVSAEPVSPDSSLE